MVARRDLERSGPAFERRSFKTIPRSEADRDAHFEALLRRNRDEPTSSFYLRKSARSKNKNNNKKFNELEKQTSSGRPHVILHPPLPSCFISRSRASGFLRAESDRAAEERRKDASSVEKKKTLKTEVSDNGLHQSRRTIKCRR